MAVPPTFDEFIESVEQMITARNIEEYRQTYPDWPEPPVPYSVLREQTWQLWRQFVPSVHTELVITGEDGRATVEFAEMLSPVVAIGQTTSHLVIVEDATATTVTVRALDGGTGVAGVGVHVTVTEAGLPAGS
ncbi:hypothetical protein [Nocardia farcinica]|uniref:hypothetical protein n=1 Tax=Nocardia farcinica TaxID=37329 RepID=UPI0034410DD2